MVTIQLKSGMRRHFAEADGFDRSEVQYFLVKKDHRVIAGFNHDEVAAFEFEIEGANGAGAAPETPSVEGCGPGLNV